MFQSSKSVPIYQVVDVPIEEVVDELAFLQDLVSKLINRLDKGAPLLEPQSPVPCGHQRRDTI